MTVPTTSHRTDPLPAFPNLGKKHAVRRMLTVWREAAGAVAADQWRRFFETGTFHKHLAANQEAAVPTLCAAKERIGAQRLQMVRYQVVGTLQSFIANRQNEVRRIVEASGLDALTKYQIHTINTRQAWFERRAVFTSDGSVIPVAKQRLARRIMKHVLSQHRRPSFRYCNMVVDRRQAMLSRAARAQTFDYWLRLGTLDRGKVNVPLRSYPYHETRDGTRCQTVQVNTDRDGALKVGVVTDVTAPFQKNRITYQPLRDSLAIDFGLATLLATDEGDLMGRDFLAHLARLDRQIDNLARHRQRAGQRVRSARYDRLVRQLQGYVTTEINRVLERLVRLKRPATLIVERLDFTHPGLSRRMNRLVRRCGRAVFRKKLQDLEERFGVATVEVNAAYSSQQCARCGFTSRDNRPTRATLRCVRCGHTAHADVDAARVVRVRRSDSGLGDPFRSRRQVLAELKRRGLHADAAPIGQRQAGGVASRRSAQRGWSGKPSDAGYHPLGPAGSALRDAATTFGCV